MPEPIDIILLGTGCGIPSPRRHHPAVLLKYKGEYMLFDCGENVQLQLEKAGVSPMKISKIFITHWHADHFAGLLPLLETLHLSRREKPLEIYAPEASRFIDAIVELSYWGIGFKVIARDISLEKEIEKIEDKEYEIYAVKTKHSVPSCGYCFKEKDSWRIDVKKAKKYGLEGKILKEIKEKGKIVYKGKTFKIQDVGYLQKGKKIIYSGDTIPCKNIFSMAKEADLLIHDGTFLEPEPERPHASASEVAKLSKKYKVKKLVLTHLSRRYKTSQEILKIAKPIFKDTVIAEDLMRIRI